MEQYTREQIDLIIEEQLRSGKTQKEISEDTKKTINYIMELKKKLIAAGKLSDEEIEKAREARKKQAFIVDPKIQIVLQYARQGLSQTDIAYEVKSNQNAISRILKKLKEYGVISQEEIDEARKRYDLEVKYDDLRRDRIKQALEAGRLKSEFAAEVGLTQRGARIIQNSLIEEGRLNQEEVDRAVATKGKEAQRRARVVELLKQGYLYSEVTEVEGYSPVTVRKIKDKAISDGFLTEEEYQQKRALRRQEQKQVPKIEKEEEQGLEEKVLKMLKDGKDMFYMRRKTGKSKKEIQAAVKKLMQEERITDDEIKEARTKAAEELERKVLIGLRKGESQREIVDSFGEGEVSLQAVQTVIGRLKEKGKITDEQIAIYKFEAEQGERELQAFVLRGIRQGLSRVNMAKQDETGYFTEARIKHAIRRMKAQGIITDKDLKKGKKARRKDIKSKTKEKRKTVSKTVLTMLLEGASTEEIASALGYKEETARLKISDLKKQGKITDEQIKSARQKREDAQKKKEDTLYSNYKNNLHRAQKWYKGDSEPTDAQINGLVEELLVAANELVGLDLVSKDELKLMFDVLLMAREIDLSNVLGISKIYLKQSDFQTAVYTLNYSKSFFSEEKDLKQIDSVVKSITLYKRKMEAVQMMQQKYPLEVIQQRTKLGTDEILALQTRVQNGQTQGVQGKKGNTKESKENIFPEFLNI